MDGRPTGPSTLPKAQNLKGVLQEFLRLYNQNPLITKLLGRASQNFYAQCTTFINGGGKVFINASNSQKTEVHSITELYSVPDWKTKEVYFEDPKDTIKAELVEDLDLVTPTALEQALEKVRPNLNVADTAKKQAQEMQDRKGFALLATKFMKEGGTIMVTIDGKEMKVEKIEYLETFGQLALFDSSKKIENRENTPFTFTPKIPGQVKGSAKDPEEVHVEELPPMSTFFSDELGDDTPPAQEHSEPFTREQEVAKLNQIFNDLRQLTPLPNDADDETREERQQSMEDATNRINDFIYKRERGNIRFTSTEDINDYYLLSNVLYFDDDRLVFSATDNSDTEIDRQNMTMSIEEISDEGEVSVEGAEEVTAESLGAEWESIKGKMTSLFFTNSLLLDEGGLFSAQLDRDIATFISGVEKFLARGGKMFASKGGERIAIISAAPAVGGIVFYSGTTVIGTSTHQDVTTSKTVPTQIPYGSDIIFEDPKVE